MPGRQKKLSKPKCDRRVTKAFVLGAVPAEQHLGHRDLEIVIAEGCVHDDLPRTSEPIRLPPVSTVASALTGEVC
jgi:hypothetical protein